MGGRKRTPRDLRRRSSGQNFLVDDSVVRRFLSRAEIVADDHVVELGAGTGALTIPLAARGARVTAVEWDPVWAASLRQRVGVKGLADRVRVVQTDLLRFSLPASPYRVVSSPPFGLTTQILCKLFDDPVGGPERADLLLQREVAVKRTRQPPNTLQSAAWAPWWSFELGHSVPRTAFRPVPRIDAAWLTVRRRQPAVLPEWLAPGLREVLRTCWDPPSSH